MGRFGDPVPYFSMAVRKRCFVEIQIQSKHARPVPDQARRSQAGLGLVQTMALKALAGRKEGKMKEEPVL